MGRNEKEVYPTLGQKITETQNFYPYRFIRYHMARIINQIRRAKKKKHTERNFGIDETPLSFSVQIKS